MPRVPQYQDQASPSRSLGVRPQRPNQSGAEARGEALNELETTFRDKFKQDLKSEIVDAETQYQERARETMQDLRQLKGEEAVSNEATGRPGVYEKSRQKLDELKEDFQDRLPQDYQGMLDSRLEDIKQSWMGKAASWEESERQELQDYRAKQAATAAQNHIQGTAGDPDEMKRATKRAAQQIRAIHGDNYVSQAKIQAMKQDSAKTAILASMDDPDLARQHLDENKNLFDESQVQTFERMIEDAQVKRDIKRWTDRLAGMPYETQLATIQEEIQDPDLQSKVLAQVRGEKELEEAIRNERRSQHYQDMWQQVMMAKHRPGENSMPSVQELMDDPLLSVPQREKLIRMVGGQEESEDERRAQNQVWYELHRRINSGRNPPSRREIQDVSSRGLITPGMERSLLRELDDGTDFPSLGKAKDHLRYQLREKSEVISSDEQWKDFQRDLEIWARQKQQETGRNPTYDEIMQMGEKLAEPAKDWSWWHFFTGNPSSPYKREELPHYREVVKPEGVPEDAQWDGNAGAYLVERGGDVFAMVPTADGIKKFRRKQESGE